ncbi:alpha-1,3-galactosidase-related protein [Bythopirellula polymerisocia]|uniref:Alpha-1,3-galactosidase B n=1 Tax=Bythopirellula polymerisocia TaxID=2528003 RepID=A0A5C6CUW6_9BACT|nr:right-handed parallel beta-helix repeat-containing protein [Bythopirellula polymerisocia]TWU28370.1 Alpha-1,3-galactosidase B precursor [Bythopirellula polymerisocia]
MIFSRNTSHRTITSMILAWLIVFAATGTLNAEELNIVDFGARPDDGSDDTRAVRKAIQACQAQGAKRLVLPKGRYDFYPEFATEMYFFISNNDEGLKRVAFPLVEMRDLVIDGQGSECCFHGFINPFILDGCHKITLENFSVDYARPFHSEAIILGHDAEGMDVEIREGFPYKVHRGTLLFTGGQEEDGPLTTVSQGEIYGSSHMLEFDTEKRETAYLANDFYFSPVNGYPAKKLDGRKVRIRVPELEGVPGNTMVFGPNHRNFPGFVVSDCADVLFRNVTIHHAGGMGILGQRTHNVTVDHCKVTPSHGRMVSTTADATHFVNCTGKIALTHNLFENQKDDATNIHGIYVQMAEQSGSDEVIVKLKHHQQHGFDFLRPGVQVELVHARNMMTYATTTVKAAERLNKECTKLVLSSPLPDEFQPDDVLAEVLADSEVTIANNVVRNNRARGVLLNCRGKTIVENNYFHTPGAAILFAGDSSYWFEQGGVRDCVIRNNTFDNCLFGVWGKAIIDFKAGIREDKEISRYDKNIRITGNSFRVFDQSTLLNAYCVDGLIWNNNTVERTNAYPSRDKPQPPYVIEFCDNVTIDGKAYQ